MDDWVWSNGGMILTGENWSTWRKTLYSVGGRWMIEYGAMVELYWQGKTEFWEQNLFHRHFVHRKSHMLRTYRLLPKLTFADMSIKSLPLVANRKFINFFTGTHIWFLWWATLIQFRMSHPTRSSHLHTCRISPWTTCSLNLFYPSYKKKIFPLS